MKRIFLFAIYMTSVISLAVVSTAHAAYIDPNTGGMLFQVLAVLFGLFSGILLFFSSQVKKFFYSLTRKLRGAKSVPAEDTVVKETEENQE